MDGFNALDLDNNHVLDHEIDPVAKVNLLPFVNDWQPDLAGDT